MHCEKCGKQMTKSDMRFGNNCQACYRYYRDGGIENPLPDRGVIAYDYRGYVICHICGRTYKRLGSHVKELHEMTIAEYKEKFGLCNNARTTEKSYSAQMSNYAFQNHMDDQLRIVGVNTRIKKGETDKRKGKAIRLQEHLNKINKRKA